MEFCTLRQEAGETETTLSDFLAEISLASDQDNGDEAEQDKVTLMTVHASKGLEFKQVFIVGVEENLFPSSMCQGSEREIEEERRLLYVAITRAEENCTLTYALTRYRNGQTVSSPPSRFIKELDPRYVDLPARSGSKSLARRKSRGAARSVANGAASPSVATRATTTAPRHPAPSRLRPRPSGSPASSHDPREQPRRHRKPLPRRQPAPLL